MKQIFRILSMIALVFLGAGQTWASVPVSNPRVTFVYEENHGTAFASEADENRWVTITVTPEGDYRCLDGDLTAETIISSINAGVRTRTSINYGEPIAVTCTKTNEFTLQLPADDKEEVRVTVRFSEKDTFTPTVSIEGWTYGDAAKTPTVGNNTSGGGVTYTYADTQDGNFDTPVPTQAGSHWVKATVAATANYKACESDPVVFEISQKSITINEATVGVEDKVYDGTTTATLSGTFSFDDGMIVEGDDVGINASEASATFADANVGSGKTVSVTGLALAGADMANYVLTNSTFTTTGNITQKDLTVTARNHSINYGDEPANDGVTYDGFVNGEDESKLGGTLGFDYNYSQNGPVGTYQITPKGLTSDNYNILFHPGTLTVNQKATISVDWDDNNNFGGLRPESLTFQLLADDVETDQTVTLDEGNWSATVNGLAAYNDENLIEYTWSLESTPERLNNNYESDESSSTTETGATATFTYTRKTGSLTVTNTVASDLAADKDVEFTFTVTLDDTTISGTYGDMTFAGGVATFTLTGQTDNSSKTATGLLYGTTYTVTQADATGFQLTEKIGDTGTISEPSTQAEFTNTRETGGLIVTNTVVSALAADADAEFTFTVTLGDTSISGTYGDMTYAGGVATVTLKGGQSATATNLPTSLDYTVTQADAEGFQLTGKTGDTGTISMTQSEATFTNTRETGDLTVTNTVTSVLAADATVEFEFTVTLSDTTIGGTYGDMDFEDGVATFNLKGGQSRTATGLPTTLEYIVTQTAVIGFTTTSTGEGDAISTTESKAEFTNERETNCLYVYNTVCSDDTDDANVEFSFTVTLSDTSINGKFGGEDNAMTFENGVATFTLKSEEEAYAGSLPTTLGYTVTQTAVGGFTTYSQDENLTIVKGTIVEGTISDDTSVVEFKNIKNFNATVKIVWNDNNDQDGKRPTEMTATLEDNDGNSYEVTLNSENSWTDTVDDLPMCDTSGQVITYTWTQDDEDLPEVYNSNMSTEGNVTTITNSHTPEETTVKVSKVWNDNNNKGGLRTESVTVNLMKGETVVGSVELNADNEWTYTWMQLPKYENGNAIDYTVTEDPVANYLTEITKATDGTFTYTVTNTLQVNVTIAEGTGSTDPLSFSGTITDLDYSRTLTAPGTDDGDITIDNEPANLYTVCLPFTPKTDTGMTYYTLSGVNSGVNGTTLSFTEVPTTDLAAFTPYVAAVKGNNDITESCNDVTFDTDEGIQSTTVNGFTFTGTLTGLTNAQAAEAAGDGSVTYILQSGGNWGQVPANTSGVFIPPFRAYITGPELSPSGARQMNSSFTGEETGIDSIRLVDKDGTERWYDLNGRRIDRPTHEGVYIQNGKKVVVK